MQMYFEATDYCHPNIVKKTRERINKYHGQEVFFGGRVDDEKKIYELEVLARGNKNAVPVVYREAENYDIVLHNHPSGVIRPSDADLQVASVLAEYGVGFYIVDNEFSKINIVVPLSEVAKKNKLIKEEVMSFFSSDSSDSNDALEERPSQKKMVLGILEAFNEDKIYACEAPTGTGKSMAYLVPAFHWIKANRERVVISTNTINLQEQLIRKDIPQVEKKLGEKISHALVKGRGNYLCQRKFARFKSTEKENMPMFMETENQIHQINEILEWGGKTETGDKGELSFVPQGYLWDQVSSEADTCRRSKCPSLEHCFYQKARKKIFSADLLIVNHHILCADASLKKEMGKYNTQALLPAYNRLIIDEAHNLEEVGTSYFALTASRFALERNLGLVVRLNKKRDGAIGGALFALYEKLKNHLSKQANDNQVLNKKIKELENILDVFIKRIKKSPSTLNYIFDELFSYLTETVNSDFQEKKLRLKSSFLDDDFWISGFKNPIDNLSSHIRTIVKEIKKAEVLFKSQKVEDDVEQILHELQAYRSRLESIINTCQQSLNLKQDEEIHWVTGLKRKERPQVSINISPLYVGEELYQSLFKPVNTIVLTSATLKDSRGFNFFSQSVGLDQIEKERMVFEHLPSNFNYQANCNFIIPQSIPMPHTQGFSQAVAETIEKTAPLFNGQILVLFTSYEQLIKVTNQVRDPLSKKGFSLLVQGEAPRQQLVERFKNGTKQILCGVNSFWEGIDIKGKALSCVMMVKIPFIVPTEPIHEARLQQMEKKGINSFVNYMLPLAIIRFKQGFGRLLRGSDDTGTFMVLDRRLLDKSYGRVLINSLPGMTISKELSNIFDE